MVVLVHCADILLLRCTSIVSKTKINNRIPSLNSEPSPRLSQSDELPSLSATFTCWRSGSKYKAYFPCWAGCTNWTDMKWKTSLCHDCCYQHVLVTETHSPKQAAPRSFCSFPVTICKAGTRKAYTLSQKIWISPCLKTSDKPRRGIFSSHTLHKILRFWCHFCIPHRVWPWSSTWVYFSVSVAH